ncbi:MAG: DNRLRE domain-containing protein [Caldilineaceae bacterium]
MHRTLASILVRLCCGIALWLGALLPAQVAAQDATPTPPPAPLERGLQRSAPVRQPTVLSTTTRALAQGSVTSTVIQIPAEADTYIASERADQNFGGDALFLGFNFFGDRFGAQRILIRFNVDTIPAHAQIKSARLRLRLSYASPSDDSPMRTVLRRLTSDWDEFGVTWNNEPQWGSVRDSSFVGATPQWYEWEIPDLVQGWTDDSFPNFGLELIGDETIQQRERVFYARETTTDFFPQLIVDYQVINDISPPAVTVDPLPAYVGRSFTVSWSGSDVGDAGIAYYDVQYRIDGGDWVDWLGGVTTTVDEFTNGQNGHTYEFRARGVDNVGNVEPFGDPQASTVVDTAPPTSRINPLPGILQTDTFVVSWSGNDDDGSGIHFYDIRYRMNGGAWQLWQQQTLATSATFTAPSDGLYEFEVRAVDNVGRAESFTGQPEARVLVDAAPPFIVPQQYLPFVFVP